MSKNTQLSDVAANAEADAIGRLLDNGYLRIYDGAQPADADTAVTTQNLLAELRFAATSAPAALGGVLTFSTIAAVVAAATGTAAWFRALKSDGTSAVFDGSVGASAANMILAALNIQADSQVSVSNFTYTAQKAATGV